MKELPLHQRLRYKVSGLFIVWHSADFSDPLCYLPPQPVQAVNMTSVFCEASGGDDLKDVSVVNPNFLVAGQGCGGVVEGRYTPERCDEGYKFCLSGRVSPCDLFLASQTDG